MIDPMHDSGFSGDPKAAGPAVFAGGCFWCTEAVFEQLEGVTDVQAGYTGGSADSARYDQVCSGLTNHAEAIQITYDSGTITYKQLLEVFFTVAHDPTQINRQGPDSGRQYRSAIFYADELEKNISETFIIQIDQAGVFDRPIVTTLEPLDMFYPAEEDHQNYVLQNPSHPYVVCNALPKVQKVRERFADRVIP